MDRKPITEADYFVAWILFFLCATVSGAIVGAVCGAIMGVVFVASGIRDTDSLRLVGAVTGFVVSLPISYLFFRVFVGKLIVAKLLERMSAVQGGQPVQQAWPTYDPGSQQNY